MISNAVKTVALVLLACFLSSPVAAEWSQDPTENNPVCIEPGETKALRVAGDGAGGMFMVWEDHRSGDADIYAQHLDVDGNPQWAVDGVAVCVAAHEQFLPDLASDGAGGAIIAWKDNRLDSGIYKVFAQRIGPSGTPLWSANGRLICNREFNQSFVNVVSDGDGGAIISWSDFSGGLQDGIHAQRVNADGTALWTPQGVPVCDEWSNQSFPRVVSDGAGGALYAWLDLRGGDDDIYAQRIDGNGAVLWDPAGVPVCTAAEYQYIQRLACDGSGGALITWQDGRDGNLDIYAQRVDAGGSVVWTADGLPVCTTPENQTNPEVTTDGGGGAIVSWTDTRNGLADIYAQRVTSAGAFRWADDGVAICSAGGSQSDSDLVPDGDGGAVIVWHDVRTGVHDIYAQRVDDAGFPLWAANGVAVSTAVGTQGDPLIVQDRAGGAVMAWDDRRDDADGDIYAQWVDAEGLIGGPVANTPPVASASASPDTGFADLYVQFTNSSWDADGDHLEYFWDFGDPGSLFNTSTNDHPRHTYENAGHYSVWLTVSDGVDEDSYSIPITVLAPTISAGYTCTPSSGTVPFSTQMRTVIRNERDDQFRRAAARVSIILANGSVIGNWRAGSTTLSPGEQFGSQWFTTIPATGSVIGMNQFLLETEDVTDPPYNQPPYAPSGNVDIAICEVTAAAQ